MCRIDLTHLGPRLGTGRPQDWWRESCLPRTTSEGRCAREKRLGFVKEPRGAGSFHLLRDLSGEISLNLDVLATGHLCGSGPDI